VGVGPGLEALDVATDTIYVADSENFSGGDTISVINGSACRAGDISGCMRSSPTVTVGNDPLDVAVDQATDTVYVANGNDNTVSVIDGATCNSQVHAGCGQTPPVVAVGANPQAIAFDDATHTAYVANGADNTVSMIDTSTCNASHLGGCSKQSPPTVAVGVGPISIAVNASTHSVYVGNDDVENDNNNDGNTLSVFDASTCNAMTQAGCTHQGLLTVGTGPYSITFDAATNTVYSADLVSQTVSVTDGRTCDAANLAGCATAPEASVPAGVDAVWAEMDNVDHTLYVVNGSDDTVSVIDTGICNGRHLAACAGLVPASLQTGNGPNAAAFDPATDTIYAGNNSLPEIDVLNGANLQRQGRLRLRSGRRDPSRRSRRQRGGRR